MRVELETDEKVELVVDGTCGYEVWGERNEEGTMVIKSRFKSIFGEDAESIEKEIVK